MGKVGYTRENLHSLIEKTKNTEILEMVYEILKSNKSYPVGGLINDLNVEDKAELYTAYDESFKESELKSLNALASKHSKWKGE